jgi:two-component system sporulation sensor kinase A/two-component system, sporulation sensor kinase E
MLHNDLHNGDIVSSTNHGEPELNPEIKYHNLAEQAFVGVYIVQDGKFVYANPRMAEILGYTLDEIIGKLGPVHVVSPEDYPHIHEKSKKRLVGEIEKDYYQFQCVKKDKTIIHVEIYGSRLQYRGKPAVNGVLNDITERKIAEEELRKELQHKKDFINIASHELLTPLVPILGYLDIILADPEKYGLNAEGKRLLDLMMWSARNEERIVNRILEYSLLNVEKEKIQPQVRTFSPRTVIDVILDSNRNHTDAEIDVAIPPELTLDSDVDIFYGVLFELFSNAVEYSNIPRQVWISYRQDEKNHYFSVKDNGIGMTDETKNSLFTPFFISDGYKTSRKYGRIGLGLPIAKKLAEFIGGEIRVESEVAKGSTFTLALPKHYG